MVTQTARQLAFEFPHKSAYAVHEFVRGDCNDLAFRTIRRWRDWRPRQRVMFGPLGSGKTHLAEIWRADAGARRAAPETLGEIDPLALAAGGAVLLDGLERATSERGLFHLLNAVKETDATLLMTSAAPINDRYRHFPDLQSRLDAIPTLKLSTPDDGVLSAILLKQLRDRAISIDARVVDYALRRMERSYEAVSRLVATLDENLWANGAASVSMLTMAQALSATPGDEVA